MKEEWATMPEKWVNREMSIGNLPPGEAGWIERSLLEVDNDRGCWLPLDGDVWSTRAEPTRDVLVFRTTGYDYLVDIRVCAPDYRWRIAPSARIDLGWVPVQRLLHRDTERAVVIAAWAEILDESEETESKTCPC